MGEQDSPENKTEKADLKAQALALKDEIMDHVGWHNDNTLKEDIENKIQQAEEQEMKREIVVDSRKLKMEGNL